MKFLLKIGDISNIKRIKFREDINGLRAIAVLVVVFYHAEIEVFKGGWLGVDIFFVISGYLISNIIISELNDGTFSFRNFYLRRIRRILPALFSTLLLTLPFAYYLLTPKALQEYIGSLFASVFFYANYHFMNLDFYVAESTKLMPLLHTWSLAIEEQYYLFFPLLAFGFYKYSKKYFTFFIGCFTFGSLYLNTFSQSSDKFYRLEFRIWELLLGVLIMIISSNIKIKHLEKLGIPLMLFPIFYFGDAWINDTEPKLIALTGISLIIFSNTHSTFLTKILSLKVISMIGLSSYSIYLFHQPIFAFFRIYYTQITWSSLQDSYLSSYEVFIAIALTFVLALFNYMTVESFFIKNTNYKYIFIGVLIIILSPLFLNNAKNSASISNKFTSYTVNIENYTPRLEDKICHDISSVDDICSFNPNKNQKVILLGDSHARELGFLLSETLENYNLEIITGNSCLFLFDKNFFEGCPFSENEKSIKDYVANQNDVIYIYSGDIWDQGYAYMDLETNIPKTLYKLLSNKNSVIVLEQIPNFPFDPIQKISQNIVNSTYIGIDYSYWSNEKAMNKQLNIYKNINSNKLFLISPEEYICNTLINNACVAAINESLFYRDHNHLTIDGVNLFIKDIVKILESINSE